MSCTSPLTWQELVDYWAGDLPTPDAERIEEHVFSCASCAEASERVSEIAMAIRGAIPAVISAAEVEGLRRAGLALEEGEFRPGVRQEAVFRPGVDLLIHHLGGLDLAGAERVHVTVRVEDGPVLHEEPFAPFARDKGEVLIACQRHFASMPPNVAFEVRVHEPTGAREPVTFLVPHTF